MQTPQASVDVPTGTAEASGDVRGDLPRETEDGEERIYQDGEVAIVNS